VEVNVKSIARIARRHRCEFVLASLAVTIGWNLRVREGIYGVKIPRVLAQTSYQQQCPSNTTAWGGWQTMNPQSGRSIQFGCIDVLGQIMIGSRVYVPVGGNVQQALRDLPAAGGEIQVADANMSLGIFDPGSKSVTLRLGRGTYKVTQIILEPNFRLIGAGSGHANNTGTFLIQDAASTTPIVLNTKPMGTGGVLLQGFRLDANPHGSFTDGIFVAGQTGGGGLWYSSLRDIVIGATHPFARVGLDFNGAGGGFPPAVNQFDRIENVFVFRANSSSSIACQFIGGNGQITVDNAECDGAAQNAAGVDMKIASSPTGGDIDYSLNFLNLTVQRSLDGILMDGAASVLFNSLHTEQVGRAITLRATHANTYNIDVENSEFANSSGNDSGAGYILGTTAGAANVNAVFVSNRLGNSPDALFAGFTTNLYAAGNWNADGSPIRVVGSGGTCTMSSGTSCSSTVAFGSSCVATVQGTSPIAGACSISGSTLKVIAASTNSAQWAWSIVQ
jgi:hypothetical protein